MPNDAQLDIVIKMQDIFSKEFKKLTENMVKESKRAATQSKRSFSSIAASTTKMGRSFAGAVVSVKGLVAALAAGAIVRGMKSMAATAARAEDMNRAFGNLTRSAGLDAPKALKEMQDGLRGTVSEVEIMKLANNALLLDVVKSEEELGDLAEAGRRLGKAMGIDATKGFESLVVGIGRQSKLWLDNLGIIVNVEKAYEDYALSINKTVDALTDEERKSAFIEATHKAMQKRLKALGEDTASSSEAYARLSTSAGRAWEALSEIFNPAMVGVAEALAAAINKMADGLEAIAPSKVGNVLGQLYADLFLDSGVNFTPEQQAKIERQIRKYRKGTKAGTASASTGGRAPEIAYRQVPMGYFDLGEEHVEGYAREIMDMAYMTTSAEVSQIELIFRNLKNGIQYYVDTTGSILDQFSFAVSDSFIALENTLGNVFFDAMKGKMKSFKEYVASFVNDISRIMSQMLARQAIMGVMNAFGFYGPTNTMVNTIAQKNAITVGTVAAQLGGMPIPVMTFDGMATGGIVNEPVIAGEAGPEAIVPLPDGRNIPVEMKGGAGKVVNVNFHIRTNDAASFNSSLFQSQDILTKIIQRAIGSDAQLRSALRAV